MNYALWKVYELITRHFLACFSDDAYGIQNTIEIQIGEETFSTTDLTIKARNYLEIYTYDAWEEKEVPEFSLHDVFTPNKIELKSG